MTTDVNQISILILDDEALIAEDIRDICVMEGYAIAEVCYDAGRALNCIKEKEIDLAILDINLDGELSGIDIAKFINTQHNHFPFIFLTSYADKSTLNQAKDVRPMGYVTKPFHKEQLISTIEIALFNYHSLKSNFVLDIEKLEKSFNIHLTEREHEVLAMLCEGKNNQQMATKAFMSVNTIKYHIKNLYEKLDVNSRSQLLNKIISNGRS